MTKKSELTEDQEKELIAARDATPRPIAGQTSKPIDDETASHQWQAGSAAIDSNVLSDHPNKGQSIMDKIESPEANKAKETAEKEAEKARAALPEDDFDCSKLDVSDARYCQPGSERHKDYVKRQK